MNPKVYETLELDKILSQLVTYAAFSASQVLLQSLEPTSDLEDAQRRQRETTEAHTLLEENSSVTIGGARDVRLHVQAARRGITLNPQQLLDIKATLLSAGTLKKTISKATERFPLLNEIAYGLDEGKRLVADITRIIDDQGQILDSASPKLAQIRRDLRIAHDRLHTKLQSIVSNNKNAAYLQEALITMRGGRYVIPIKAEAKGRIRGIVHDQSSSGATLFIEPLATVEINNQIRELELAEQEEIHRILTEVTDLVGTDADRIIWTVEALAMLDAAFAKAKYASALRANSPRLIDFDTERSPGSTIRLYNARHPLIDPREVMPIDIELGEDTHALIITGPNTGGKTVSLKTTGLLTLMAQCGLHIPASPDSELTVFDAVYADIGDEQSIEQSLSTFSSHLTNIIGILERADDHSLVLVDELGAGTDPTEGAAIARAILDDLLVRGITTLVATHYPELKLYAHNTPGVRNASVEFDVETLSPTYRLIIGLPGRSNALAIATRLGLPVHIVEEARSFVGEAELRADDLLEEIHKTRDEIRKTQDRLAVMETRTRALQEELQVRLEGIEQERLTVIEQAREEARNELEILQTEARKIRRRLRNMAPAGELQEVEADIGRLEDMAEAPIERAVASVPVIEPVEKSPRRAFRLGDRVFVSRLNAEGEIIALDNSDNVEVQVGQMRVRVGTDSLEWRPKSGKKEQDELPDRYDDLKTRIPSPESPGFELHLIGLTAEDALPTLEEYLDQAYLSGLPWARIVHGRGAGILRKLVRDTLRDHPLVRKYQRAPENEGGDGVTVVRFVPLS